MKKILITVILLITAFSIYILYADSNKPRDCIDAGGFWNEEEKRCIEKKEMTPEELKELEKSIKEDLEKKIEYCNTHDFNLDKGEDGRIVLGENVFCFSKEKQCDISFNYDKPDQWISYQGNGIKIDLPYNKNWGSEEYSIRPWEENNGIISFGPITTFEGCTWLRVDNIKLLEKQTKQEVLNEINKQKDSFISNPEEIQRNGFEIIRYSVSGLCEHPAYIVLGREYNYQFSASVCTDTKGAYEYYDKLINRMEFVK